MSDDIATKLRINSNPMGTISACDLEKAADEIEKLRKDNKQLWASITAYADRNSELRHAMHDIYEVYAGSEGIPRPETCSEAYLYELVKEMVAIAAKHKKAATES